MNRERITRTFLWIAVLVGGPLLGAKLFDLLVLAGAWSADLIKLLWFDGQGLCLFSKRMDRGRFVWPVTATGTVALTSAQVSMLLEGTRPRFATRRTA